ncbi:hypothetical protein TNIN_111201 [Trichonephila inaurata madagascariensis]|uniref:Uncharacterized protein n=1 Tax=Trichonephila inaurata madagascariensis TaxID=2747483 RepID=A0A8X6XK47_9ARAC|nr:hypothetical protein TNIN_111201 [Trichonephila inaurata madagascariensis]
MTHGASGSLMDQDRGCRLSDSRLDDEYVVQNASLGETLHCFSRTQLLDSTPLIRILDFILLYVILVFTGLKSNTTVYCLDLYFSTLRMRYFSSFDMPSIVTNFFSFVTENCSGVTRSDQQQFRDPIGTPAFSFFWPAGVHSRDHYHGTDAPEEEKKSHFWISILLPPKTHDRCRNLNAGVREPFSFGDPQRGKPGSVNRNRVTRHFGHLGVPGHASAINARVENVMEIESRLLPRCHVGLVSRKPKECLKYILGFSVMR